jgi:predicted RNA-binding protein
MDLNVENTILHHLKLMEEVLKGSGKIISIKILFPFESSFKSLKNILVCNGIEHIDYCTMDNKFIFGDGESKSEEIKRTLSFLKYAGNVKYKELPINKDRTSKDTASETTYLIEFLEDVKIGGIDEKFKDSSNIEQWWKEWYTLVNQSFPSSKSTLWSYVNYRKYESENWIEFISSAFVVFDCFLNDEQKDALNRYCQELLYALLIIQLFQEIKQNAIKSAIAAIMSRNMSHNLGSHVFFYTRQELLKIYDKQKDIKTSDAKENASMVKGIAWFLHYVQERQDFIANINSGDEFIFGPLNFKQDVIDEITPDGVDYRHNSLPKTNNYLLKNIVLSENITRNEYLADKDFYDGVDKKDSDNEIKDIDISVNFNDEQWISTWITDGNMQNFYDIDMAVGGGQQSRHAFLIILENIIRNSAKHGGKLLANKFNKLKISIEIHEQKINHIDTFGNKKSVEGFQITIYDNIENANSISQDANLTNLENLQSKLHTIKMLDDETLIIDRNSKGLKEILITILWMKGLSLEHMENYCNDDDILSLVNVNDNIGFRFYLPKFLPVVQLQANDIERIFFKNEYTSFGSIYHTSKKELEDALLVINNAKKSTTIRDKDYSLDELKEFLTQRIPRMLCDIPKDKNLWQTLAENNFKISKKPKISFDRYEHAKTIGDLKDIVLLQKSDNINGVSIIFNNHLSQSISNMESKRDKFNENYFVNKNAPIYETISGANQVFNIMQKLNIPGKENDISDKVKNNLINLYWNIIESYNTKIVIVDERLSFPHFSKKCIDNKVLGFAEGLIKADVFSGMFFDEVAWDMWEIQKKLSSIQNNTKSHIDKIKEVILFLDTALDSLLIDKSKKTYFNLSVNFKNKYRISDTNGNVRFIKNDIKELFYNQQNTFLCNLNSDLKLVQSSGIFEFPQKYKVDFFSIHIGLLDKITDETELTQKINNVLAYNNLQPKFVSVHSGRGGLNSENDKVTFIPFSSLQRCLEDSKYMLTDFLYNYKYLPI